MRMQYQPVCTACVVHQGLQCSAKAQQQGLPLPYKTSGVAFHECRHAVQQPHGRIPVVATYNECYKGLQFLSWDCQIVGKNFRLPFDGLKYRQCKVKGLQNAALLTFQGQ